MIQFQVLLIENPWPCYADSKNLMGSQKLTLSQGQKNTHPMYHVFLENDCLNKCRGKKDRIFLGGECKSHYSFLLDLEKISWISKDNSKKDKDGISQSGRFRHVWNVKCYILEDVSNIQSKNNNMCVAQLLESCLTLCDLMDCSLPGSSVHRILQARILGWVAMPSSMGSSQPRD